MSPSPNVELRALQASVQQRLGQCVVQLQAYEGLIKTILAECEVSGTANDLGGEARVADTGRKTLGLLVGQLMGSFLTAEVSDSAPESEPKPADGLASFRVRIQIGIPADDFAKIESDLKDFVCLRNELIHHFIERHDLTTVAGCRFAEGALVAAYSRIERHFDDLRQWAQDLIQTRQQFADFLGSDMVRDILVSGKVPLSLTPIVAALREAAAELAVDGWAPVVEASELLLSRHPDELPANYGCRSWRQVLQESGAFELRYRETEGSRAAWYRERMPGKAIVWSVRARVRMPDTSQPDRMSRFAARV